MTQPIEEKTIRLLRRHYFINFIVLGILFLLTLFPVARIAETPTSPPVIIDQCSILLTIIGIPVALKSFSNKINKKPRPNDAKKGIKIYKSFSPKALPTKFCYSLEYIGVCHLT